VRFSKVIAVTLAAGPAGALAAYEKARSSFTPQPPQPDFAQVVEWAMAGNDWVALGTIALAAISMGYSIYQMCQPDPATKKDVKEDGRKTRKGIEHTSKQVAAEGQASEERDKLTHRLVSGELHERVEAAVDADAIRQRQRCSMWGGDWDRMIAEETLGDISFIEGQLPSASAHYYERLRASQAVLNVKPDDSNRQREVSVSHNCIGNIARAQSKWDTAFGAYTAFNAIMAKLVITDPSNATWQRDLSVSYNRLGDVAVAQDDLAGARTAYAASLAIIERLATQDKNNNEWQRDLSVSYSRFGSVAVARGDLPGGQVAYAKSLAIIARLAAQDFDNAQWQRDLFISHAKFAQFNEASGDAAGSIREFEAGEAILVALIARVGDHPGFARDLAQVRGEIARLRGD
jgi:hypothetical protein